MLRSVKLLLISSVHCVCDNFSACHVSCFMELWNWSCSKILIPTPELKEGSEEILRNQTAHKTRASKKTSKNDYPEESQMLKDFYSPWNKNLAELLGDNKWTLWNELDETETI